MSSFGKTLFSGSRFIFWTVSPILLLFALGMLVFTLTSEELTFLRIVLSAVLIATSLLFILGLYDPLRFRWALRTVTDIVFVAYVAYAIDMFVSHEDSLAPATGSSHASLRNALIGFIVIGIPCLWFSITGRFTLREPEDAPAEKPEESLSD